MGYKWFIKRKPFDCAAKQLTVTVNLGPFEGGNKFVSKPFGRDEDDIKWQLIYSDPENTSSIYLEKIGGEKSNHSFVVDVPDKPDAVRDNVTGLRTTGNKFKIGVLSTCNSFDIKITYPDSLFMPEFPIPANRSIRGKFCDVKFLVGRETIGFYKVMLALKSDVFETMFSSPVTDPLKVSEPIEIKDASAIGFNAFLDVVYDGTVPKDTDVCFEVLGIAEKYNCEYVKSIIAPTILLSINKQNAIKILMAAYDNGMTVLKSAVMDFIANNPVYELPDAKLLVQNADLMIEVFKKTAKK